MRTAYINALALITALLIAVSAIPVRADGGSGRPVKIGMYTTTDVKGNGIYIWLEPFANHLRESGFQVQVFPNGSLGGDRERIDQMVLDLLEVNVTNPDEIARLSPTFYGISPMFMFDSYAHMDRFLENTPFMDTVNQELKHSGFRFVDMAYTGAMVGLLTRKVPVRSLEDLQKIRLRFLSAPDLKLFAGWGVRGVQVSWGEVSHALQTGMVDGYLNPPAVATMFGHGSVLDYFTDLRMGPSARLIVVATSWLESLSASDKAIFENAVRAGRRANRTWNQAYIAKEKGALEDVGISWIEPLPGARQDWAKRSIKYPSEKWYSHKKAALVQQWVEESRKAANDG